MRRGGRQIGRTTLEGLESRQLFAAITPGQTVSGNLALLGETDKYTFTAQPGQTIYATLCAAPGSSVVPSLRATSPNGQTVINTDAASADSFASNRYKVTSGNGGTYTLGVADVAGAHTGGYRLELAVIGAANAADSNGDGGPIKSGQTLVGSTDRLGDLDVYTFTAHPGQSYRVGISPANAASTVRPYMQVYSPTGMQIFDGGVVSDQTGTFLGTNVPAGQGGTYSVVVGDNMGVHLGDYAVEMVVAPAVQQADSDGDGGALVLNQAKGGYLQRPTDVDVYTFTTTQGVPFGLKMLGNPASEVWPFMQVFDPQGNKIYDKGTTAKNTSLDTGFLAAPSSGRYTVLCGDNMGTHLGSYAVKLEGAVVPVTPAVSVAAPGQSASVNVAKSFKLGTLSANFATAPFSVSVSWGDGSADETFTMNATGALPNRTHTYKTTGDFVAKVVVTDAQGMVAFSMPVMHVTGPNSVGSVSGVAFNDGNRNGKQDVGDTLAGGKTIWLDLDDDGKKDANEPATTTAGNGTFKFGNLKAGTYHVRRQFPSGYVESTPARYITLSPGQTVSGVLVGSKVK